jgi:glucose/mannose-6-phosphate isomerase
MLSGEVADKRIQLQEKISQSMLRKYMNKLQVVTAQGGTDLVRSMYLLHLCDWISFYVAQKKVVDPLAIQLIDQVKAVLYEN